MTDRQRKLSVTYLVYKGLTSLWFASAVWLYFYRIFVTDQQTGMIDGLAFALGLLAEVPSGALADRFGRDTMVRLGHLLAGFGFIFQALYGGFAPFLFGLSVVMIGVAFVSGADEALFFDALKFRPRSHFWRKLVSRGTQVSLIASICAVVIGGWAYTISPNLPFLLSGSAILVSAIWVWQVADTRKKQSFVSVSQEFGKWLDGIKLGFSTFSNRKLLRYAVIIMSLESLYYAFGWGLLKLILLGRFEIPAFFGSIVLACGSLISIVLLALLQRHAERINEVRFITLVVVSAAVSLLAAIFPLGVWGVGVILTLYVGNHLLTPVMSEALNNRIKSNQRATTLSVASFLRTIPYVVLAPLIGYLNTNGNLEYLLAIWTVVLLAAAGFFTTQQCTPTKHAVS